jgi:hypothetical protein
MRSVPRRVLLALAASIALESCGSAGDTPTGIVTIADVAPFLAAASLDAIIPNAFDAQLTVVPKSLPRTVDPQTCAYNTAFGRFDCSVFSISQSQAYTGFTDTLDFQLLGADGTAMAAFDRAATAAIRTRARIGYVTQENGIPLPGEMQQEFVVRPQADGGVVMDGKQVVHASITGGGSNYRTVTVKGDTLVVIISEVRLPVGGRVPSSGTVTFSLKDARLGPRVDVVSFNGTTIVPLVRDGTRQCTYDLAGTSYTAISCPKP